MIRFYIVLIEAIIITLLIGCVAVTPSSIPTPTTTVTATPPTVTVTATPPENISTLLTPTPAPKVAINTPPQPTPKATQRTWTLKFSYEQEPMSAYELYGHQPLAQSIEKATNGRVKVTLSQLTRKSRTVDDIKHGRADMAWIDTKFYPSQFEFAESITLPFIANSAEVASRVSWTLFEKYPEIRAQWADLKVLSTWTSDSYFILSPAKLFKTMSDFQFESIFSADMTPQNQRGLKAIGFNLTGMAINSVYKEMNAWNKLIKAGLATPSAYSTPNVLLGVENLLTYRLYEVASYYTFVPTICHYNALIMDKGTWESFPKDIQEAIMSVCGETASINYGKNVFDKARQDLPNIVKTAGYTMNEYTIQQGELQKMIDKGGKPAYDYWVKLMQADGLNNAQAILDDTIALAKSFSK